MLKNIKTINDVPFKNSSCKLEITSNETVFINQIGDSNFSFHMAVKVDSGDVSNFAAEFNGNYSMTDKDGANKALTELYKWVYQPIESPVTETTDELYIKAEPGRIYTIGDLKVGGITDIDFFGIIRVAVDLSTPNKGILFTPDEDYSPNDLSEEIIDIINNNFDRDLEPLELSEWFKAFQYAFRRLEMEKKFPTDDPKPVTIPDRKKKEPAKKEEETKKSENMPKEKEQKNKRESQKTDNKNPEIGLQTDIITESQKVERDNAFLDFNDALERIVKSHNAPAVVDFSSDKNFESAVIKIVKKVLKDAFGA